MKLNQVPRYWANKRVVIIMYIVAIFLPLDLFSQSYVFSLNQRRCYDQIHVELWAKSTGATAPKLGHSTLVVAYNSNFLAPASAQSPASTDSISNDYTRTNLIDAISSTANSANGFSALGTQSYGSGYYALELNLVALGSGGLTCDSTGRGTFLGKLVFNIINSPDTNALTQIEWSKSAAPGIVVVTDFNGNDIKSSCTLSDPGQTKIIGINILAPTREGLVIDRDKAYPQLLTVYANTGFPIYFERSVNPSAYPAPGGQTGINDNIGYSLSYSLDNAASWTESARWAETDKSGSSVGSNPNYRYGEVFSPTGASGFLITAQDGAKLSATNYRLPLRVIWSKNPYFSQRSEQARLRIDFLSGAVTSPIVSRDVSSIGDIEKGKLVLGRLFFLQLDGKHYLRTVNNFSNSTQLTVESWVNLNEVKQTTNTTLNPALVASSGGPAASEVFGSKEGAWMLYLKNGRIPSFRVREMLARGDSGYIADISAWNEDTLSATADSIPLPSEHSKNWTHIAATVNNNVVSLYVNGELAQKFTNTKANDIRMLTTNHPIWIGINPNNTVDTMQMLRAGMKGVRVWRVALTQDQIRFRAAGIALPSEFSSATDLKRALELYYSFEGNYLDEAKDTIAQNGPQALVYYDSASKTTDSPKFRPDIPHIRLLSPSEGAGVSNRQAEKFPIRWISYGLGDFATSGTKDVEFEYSIDGGAVWTTCKDSSNADLGGSSAIDAENCAVYWLPYNNNNATANLRTINPYYRKTILRARGSQAFYQTNITDVTPEFTVAPFFAIRRDSITIISAKPTPTLSILGNTAVMEAWIRPYRFPTTEEGFFPILEKIDTVSGKGHYSLRLLSSGRIQFSVTDTSGTDRVFVSDSTKPIQQPNSYSIDSAWTHVAVYLNLNDGKAAPEVRIYIDGTPEVISSSIVSGVVLKTDISAPMYIGYVPAYSQKIAVPDPANVGGYTVSTQAVTPKGFIGEMREIRFWNGTPNKTNAGGAEPTPMTAFLQGALTQYAFQLPSAMKNNLVSDFAFNGGSLSDSVLARNIVSSVSSSIAANFYIGRPEYVPCEPYIKLIEPKFRESVPNSKTDVRVRWIGFNYKGDGFSSGARSPITSPSLEYSIRSSNGSIVQLYQYVASIFFVGNTKNSFTLPNTSNYRFSIANGNEIQYAGQLDVTIADPDINKNGTNKQGALSAALTNSRLRLTGAYSIFNETREIQSEGPLFSITPSSNFTVRTLLEGYHNGSQGGKPMRNVGSTYVTGGLKIKLFADENGTPGALLDSAESSSGYSELNPSNRNAGNYQFGNINFIFTDKYDGAYWVAVYHLNHLPVMSRFPAPFLYTGDDLGTWRIESGWDFESWNGVDNNTLQSQSADPWVGNTFSAYGSALINKQTSPNTALIFNNGPSGLATAALPAMVGGDVNADGVINARDRADVRLSDGTSQFACDVTGDGIVNADDRTIVDRNVGRYSSLQGTSAAKTANAEILSEAEQEDLKKIESNIDKYFVSAKANGETILSAGQMETAAGIAYDVFAEPIYNSATKTVDLDFYIQNRGDNFSPANCTFAVNYNSSALEFSSLKKKSAVIFSSDATAGYADLRSAPNSSVEMQIPDIRTIEIDYDATNNPGGKNVPATKTYIGTLCFTVKNEATSVGFSWHKEATTVHTTNSGCVTEYGSFVAIKPILLYTATLTKPAGAEQLLPNKKFTITWTSVASSPIYLEYSTDGGFVWKKVNTEAVPANSKSWLWTTPDVYSTACYVRIVDSATKGELSRNETAFAILPGYAGFVKPYWGDMYYPSVKAVDTLRWASQGYSKVWFQISTDGGTTWTGLVAPLNAAAKASLWKIPKVTTKQAYIRMLDADDSTEITRTEKFTIIVGGVVFRNPAKNEKFLCGRANLVYWTPYDVTKFDLELSTDAGATWETIQIDVDAKSLRYTWVPPADKASNYARLRATLLGDPEMVVGTSNEFIIYFINSAGDELPANSSIGEASPNPSVGQVEIPVRMGDAHELSVSVFDESGLSVLAETKAVFNGDDTIRLNLSGNPSGVYTVIISGKEVKAVRRVVIAK